MISFVAILLLLYCPPLPLCAAYKSEEHRREYAPTHGDISTQQAASDLPNTHAHASFAHINITYHLIRLNSWGSLYLFMSGSADTLIFSVSLSTYTLIHSHTHTHTGVDQTACINDDLSQLQILNQGVIL